jgi:RNA polymerase sigma factor (sigma-70 family)
VLFRHWYDGARRKKVTVEDELWLAERFEAHRPHLQAVAYRMLGSLSEADDAVQEGWLRLSRSDTSEVGNFGGWLTTVVARVCLDMLRRRKARREYSLDDGSGRERLDDEPGGSDPALEAELADSVGIALLLVLETLTPAERMAFVLHDLFAVPFAEIAAIIDRSPEATRMLASRARRRVREAAEVREEDVRPQRHVVDAFLAASRDGRFDELVALLDPDVVLRADEVAVVLGAEREVVGAGAVATTFTGRAKAARPVLVNGVPGLVWSPGGTPKIVFRFTVTRGQITSIGMVADPDDLAALDLVRIE